MKLILNIANQHFTVTVLLEYIDLFTTCMKIMLGPYYSVDIMFNALPSLKVTEISGVGLQITVIKLFLC